MDAPQNVPRKRPSIVAIAMLAAILMAVVSLASAVLRNPIIALPQAILATVAAVGLKRGNPWAGYGLALFLLCSTAGVILMSAMNGSLPNEYLVVTAIVPLAIGAVALMAGHALSDQDMPTSSGPLPWVVASAIPVGLSLFFTLMIVPTESMEPTLFSGDTIVMLRTGAASVHRGDLVFYRASDQRNTFVKRVVGLPGDRIHLERKMLYLNGHALNEPYAVHTAKYIDQYRDYFPGGEFKMPLSPIMQQQLRTQVQDGDFLVPPGSFFVLGDNRDNSLDSRYSGVVPATAILGKPLLVCFSADLPMEQLSVPRNVLARARWNRLLKPL